MTVWQGAFLSNFGGLKSYIEIDKRIFDALATLGSPNVYIYRVVITFAICRS
jgi:hypothetical protein